MEPSFPPELRSAKDRLPATTLVLVAGLAAAATLLCVAARRQPRNPPPAADDDPRRSYAGPYENVRPGVKYVGDETCAACHVDQAATYRHHPMGQSFGPVTRMEPIERYDAAAGDPFEKLGYRFLVERSGDGMVQVEQHRGPRGDVVAEWRAPIAYTMGSGVHGRSYLTEHDGYLFQGPVSWFAQKKAWDLSPGFEANYSTERPIGAACVFCHCNDARPVADTVNRFERPVFRQYALGCERCHGPGELHVHARERGEAVADPDPTIINPGRLDLVLREAVCQQCHLEGEARVVRRGRDVFDFRPGLPLQLFWSVFVRRPELTDHERAVGQVEQMHVSRCYRASGGKLGCISCHDPHALPAPERRVAFYRDRCLACHAEKGCSLPAAARRAKSPEDSCVACHMPSFNLSDVAHTASTDHRIPRRADAGAGASETPPTLLPGQVPLLHFHRDLVSPDDPETARDLGLALVEMAHKNPDAGKELGALALPLLEGAVRRRPEDVPAWEARGFSLWLLGRPRDALAAYEAALAHSPRREQSLADAAALAEALGERAKAVDAWRRAVAVNPWVARYHHQLAKGLAEGGDWPAARSECQAALQLSPSGIDTRLLLITCLVRLGERERARGEFETLLALRPPDPEALRRWFAELLP